MQRPIKSGFSYLLLLMAVVLGFQGSALAENYANRAYKVRGHWYYPQEDVHYNEVGNATWYGKRHHGRRTASGQPFDMYGMTAAHKTLPMFTLVRVTNLKTGRAIIVQINDRGPFRHGTIIDLSYEAAQILGILGIEQVRVEYVASNIDPLLPWKPAPKNALTPESPAPIEQLKVSRPLPMPAPARPTRAKRH